MKEDTRRVTRDRDLCWLRFDIRLHPVMGCRAAMVEIHGRSHASNNETSASVLVTICHSITFCDGVSSCHRRNSWKRPRVE